MEEDGALEHSIAFAGNAKNSAGGIYKNGMTKPFKEKATSEEQKLFLRRYILFDRVKLKCYA
jgi:hypothetical protein